MKLKPAMSDFWIYENLLLSNFTLFCCFNLQTPDTSPRVLKPVAMAIVLFWHTNIHYIYVYIFLFVSPEIKRWWETVATEKKKVVKAKSVAEPFPACGRQKKHPGVVSETPHRKETWHSIKVLQSKLKGHLKWVPFVKASALLHIVFITTKEVLWFIQFVYLSVCQQ